MAKFTTTQSFSDGDQVTSTSLNGIVSGLSADTDLAADSTLTVSSGALAVGTITATNIGASAVTTAKINDDAVTSAKIADGAVVTDAIADDAVTTDKLGPEAVAWSVTEEDDKAVQADMEGETASHFVSPDVMKYHPGVAKAYGVVDISAGTISGGVNVSASISTAGTQHTISFTNNMANTNYSVIVSPEFATATSAAPAVNTKGVSSFRVDSGADFAFVVFGALA